MTSFQMKNSRVLSAGVIKMDFNQYKVNHFRFGVKTSDLYSEYKHRESNDDFSIGELNHGGEDIVCYLLISKVYKAQLDYIFDNWKFLDSIVNKRIDIILVGYDKNKKFYEEVFDNFIETLEEQSKWKWKDTPQLLLCKMESSNGQLKFSKEFCYLLVKDLFTPEYDYTFAQLAHEMKSILKTSYTDKDFIIKVKRHTNFKRHRIFVKKYRDKVPVIIGIVSTGVSIVKIFI